MELHIFDFDKTLFKSPDQPDWWPVNGKNSKKWGWYLHNDSLGRPCVPDKPDNSWWVGPVISQAKKSISNPNIVTVLATGRSDVGPNRYRIPELLKQAGLRFNGVHLNKTSNAHTHKAMVTIKYLRKYGTSIDLIQMWDDGKENLDAVKKVAAKFDIPFEGHLVKAGKKKILCTPETFHDPNHYDEDPATKLAKRWILKKG